MNEHRYYDHPQVFYCHCGRKYLMHTANVVYEGGTKREREYADWYRPDVAITHCECGKRLELVWNSQPKPRDAVFVDGKRVV